MPRITKQKRANSTNVDEIRELELGALEGRNFGEKCGDSVARIAGNLNFLLWHVVWFAVWILINSGWLGKHWAIDPYPYQFLTFVVSLESIFLSLFILMSQNGANRMANRRAQLDLQINLLAERESTLALRMLQEICTKLEIEGKDQAEIDELVARTMPKDLMQKLGKAIPDS